MTCRRTLTTKSGTFTFFNEKVSKCLAEKKCKKRGEILAPIATSRDAKKIMNLFESNVPIENCTFATNFFPNGYWIGLDVSYTENDQQKTFSNGIRWKERKHGRIYHDFLKEDLKEYSDCAIALLDPFFTKTPYMIHVESTDCSWESKNFYVCLKPADNAIAESVVQRVDFDNEAFNLPSTAAIILACAVGAVAGAFIQKRRHAKEKAEWTRVHADMLENKTSINI